MADWKNIKSGTKQAGQLFAGCMIIWCLLGLLGMVVDLCLTGEWLIPQNAFFSETSVVTLWWVMAFFIVYLVNQKIFLGVNSLRERGRKHFIYGVFVAFLYGHLNFRMAVDISRLLDFFYWRAYGDLFLDNRMLNIVQYPPNFQNPLPTVAFMIISVVAFILARKQVLSEHRAVL